MCGPSLKRAKRAGSHGSDRGDARQALRGRGAGHPAAFQGLDAASGNGIRSGIRVDRVLDVVDVPQSTIRPVPTTLPEHLRTLVLGILRFQEQTVAVLDIDKLFADYARGLG